MDRNVRKVRGLTEGTSTEPPPQEKLLKFFPGEALALYLVLEPLAKKINEDNYDMLRVWLWSSLGVSAIFCGLFLAKFWKVESPVQLGISIGAFVLYVAAIGGPFETIDAYDSLMGVFAAAVASAFMAFVPAPQQPA